VALAGADVSKERIASIIKMTRSGELGTKLAVTSKRSTLHITPQAVTFQNKAFFIVTAVKNAEILHSSNRIGSVSDK
jgi:hypothetical protein